MSRDVVHEAEKTSEIHTVRKTAKKSRKSRKRFICPIRKSN
jgi:hypothetical protein